MSYLRRLAKQTQVRFEPRRSRSFAFEPTLRVEESFVDAPPPQSAAPQARAADGAAQPEIVPQRNVPSMSIDRASESAPLPRETASPELVQLNRPRVDSSPQRHQTIEAEPKQAQRREPLAAIEVRRELPDAIEESIVFDAAGTPHHEPAREPTRTQLSTAKEAPDAKQAESVFARVRALTGQRHRAAQPPLPAAAQSDAPKPFLKQQEQIAATWPAETPRPSPTRVMHVADGREQKVNARENDLVQVSFGSIVVHVEPEAAPVPQPPQPTRQRQAAYSAAHADNLMMRSFLDRN